MALGWPGPKEHIGIWGASPTAHRGRRVAARTGAALVTVEDAWLRSLAPGRDGEPPLGLLLDERGVHFDPATVSDLEHLLATHPLDDTALLDRARAAMDWMMRAGLTKYAGGPHPGAAPEPGYVLVIDQTRGDAAVTASGGNRALFQEMLYYAQEENPGARILIKTHPETAAGHRAGYYRPEDISERVQFWTEPGTPWALLEGAIAVYTVSSQVGFEAILAGHRPRVFGQPFYAGWGLTQEERPLARRTRRLTRAQLFAAAMILYPVWFDPLRQRRCSLEEAMSSLEATARAAREDAAGWVAGGMRLWKRAPVRAMFGGRMRFANDPAQAVRLAAGRGARIMVWASKSDGWPKSALRVEDGFLRSAGLGAELVAPLSLVTDDRGIYYDATRPSQLEALITEATTLPAPALARADALRRALVTTGVTKYNLGETTPTLPPGAVLVPGQVEDDASILLGAGEIRTNAGLIAAARAAFPDAALVYKPHPDVLAGLRPGAVPPEVLAEVDLVLTGGDPAALLAQVTRVVTMTSGFGFEALLRGVPVTVFGAPFYAGWGLTDDRGPVPARRGRASLDALVHATLIAYPRYRDPVSGQPAPPELILERLSAGMRARQGTAWRLVAKAQGALAGASWIWRK